MTKMDPVDRLIELALEEDIGPGDITTDPLLSTDTPGRGVVRAKEELLVCGLDVFRRVFAHLDAAVVCRSECRDGERIAAGRAVLTAEGPLPSLLRGERTALNFLQRLSGVATHTSRWVAALGDGPARLVDTRKTTPGWRVLEKYAVRVGGARNHRMGLFDGVLIKDNHIAAAGGIRPAVEAVRRSASHLVRIEVETADLDQVDEALAAGVDVIMLDNMDIAQIRQAATRIAGRARVEVSGGVTLERLPALAAAGVDLISAGALTHQARAVDLSMKIERI